MPQMGEMWYTVFAMKTIDTTANDFAPLRKRERVSLEKENARPC